MKRLLPLLLFPLFGKAQEVKPVLSPDYLSLIRNDTSSKGGSIHVDTSNNIGRSALVVRQPYNGYTIGKIKIKGNELFVLPPVENSLAVGGSFSSTIELKSINRLLALQNAFVQGRPDNGIPAWRGPETGEQFSYGPSINTLEYDGSAYPYDVNGRLVTKGSGTGKEANAYRSGIFQTGVLSSQSLHLHGKYWSRGWPVLSSSLRLGRSSEQLVIQDNRNHSRSFAANVEGQLSWLTMTAAYQANRTDYTNDNRTGFLNRVYQQALLTPISFSNKQGTILGGGQRSYHHLADNPFFLLERNQNSSSRLHKNGSLSFDKRRGNFRFKLNQSFEKTNENNSEGLPAGSAYFPNGALVQRSKDDQHFLLRAMASYELINERSLTSRILLNYLFGNHTSDIDYKPGNAYKFQRSSNDAAFNYELNVKGDFADAGLHLTNRFYFSNTAKAQRFFLPGVSGFVGMHDAFGLESLYAKLSGSYHKFASELAVGTSFSQSGLLNLKTEEAVQYLPFQEAAGFDALSQIQHKEWSAHLQLRYRNRLTLDVNVFKRTTQNDIFHFVERGLLELRNLADHVNRGVEIEAAYNTYSRTFQTSHQISFASNRSTVTRVKEGFNFTPIAGFSNVHRTLAQGEPLGVIVGSKYLRNSAGQIIVGADGFPMVDPKRGVVGNPIPDFVMKTSNSLSWKGFTLHADVEWKKGGDVWNGTQAVLDYYGRSKTSADLRSTTAYVFNGVTIDGHLNTTQVNFYDPSLPLEKSRWVRYGHSGIAEDYIEKGDHLRINNLALAYKLTCRKYVQAVTFSLYANNLLLWTAYRGGDPNRLLYDTPNTLGLDFFNLPSTKTFGCQLSIQF